VSVKQWQKHYGEVLDNVGGFDVIDCKSCGFKHIIPIPSFEELNEMYKSKYYEKVDNFFNERFLEDKDWYDLVFKDRYDSFEKILGFRGNILDIGCGGGYFLLYGKNRGWATLGIDPSIQSINHCKSIGLDVIEGYFDENLSEKLANKFDVVHLSEVLEHVPDPENTIFSIKKTLKPGGIVCIVVPNDYNPFQVSLIKACNFKPWWVAPPHHINYFDFSSLENLLEKVGFTVILKETSFPIDIFLLMGDDYVSNDNLGRICHTKRKTFEKNLALAGLNDLKRNIYKALANLNIGREVVIYARIKDYIRGQYVGTKAKRNY
jgi:2-polyprenyl-3-methyl-5-hydroxy-6-metoxy-1,4-benzoquinol methylase